MSKVNDMDLDKYTFLNRKHLETSTECSCVYCFERFKPTEVNDFCLDKDLETGQLVPETEICPKCGIDAVVPDSLIKCTDDMLFEYHVCNWGADSANSRHSELLQNNNGKQQIID